MAKNENEATSVRPKTRLRPKNFDEAENVTNNYKVALPLTRTMKKPLKQSKHLIFHTAVRTN